MNTTILKGIQFWHNDETDTYDLRFKLYKRNPYWVKQVLKQATLNNVDLPKYIILYPRATYSYSPSRQMIRVGYYSKEQEGVAVCFTYKHSEENKRYVLAHEIGHHDHHSKNIVLESEQDCENYANDIAFKLTGVKPPNWKSVIEALT